MKQAGLQPQAAMAPRRASVGAADRAVPSVVHDVLRSPGRPLDASARAYMEPRFGADFGAVPLRAASTATSEVGRAGDHLEREADAAASRVTTRTSVAPDAARVDFSRVRVHADARAAESARQMGAHAFTVGPHIVFGAGEYAPNRGGGRELLAHELGHVLQQTATPARGDGGAALHTVGRPLIQGRWRLDRTVVDDRPEPTIINGNGAARGKGEDGSTMALATTWQETGWVHQKVGGSAQTAHWTRTRYVFKNDGVGNEYLQLRPEGSVAGRAKAEDKYYARASSVVFGRIIERTAANPTPGDRELFPTLKVGGVSAATVGDLADVDADISLGERGSVNVKIKLQKVEEGEPAQYEGAIAPYHEVHDNIDEVEVILGGRVSTDADIRTAIMSWDVAPWVSRNYNTALARAEYDLHFNSVPAPAPRPTATPTIQGGPGVAPTKARPDVFRSGNASSPRTDNVRLGGDRPDIEVDKDGYVDGPGKGGISSFDIPKAEKYWWKYPAAKPEPSGIKIRNDSPNHWAWEPAYRMKLEDYKTKLRASHPDWSKTWS